MTLTRRKRAVPNARQSDFAQSLPGNYLYQPDSMYFRAAYDLIFQRGDRL
jgi:hypothetical protein